MLALQAVRARNVPPWIELSIDSCYHPGYHPGPATPFLVWIRFCYCHSGRFVCPHSYCVCC